MRAAAALLFALVLSVIAYVPIALPPPEQEPDLSFRATTHDAFVRRKQIGTDIISTYGPWGLLQRGYDPRTDRVVLAVSALLALAFAISSAAAMPPLSAIVAAITTTCAIVGGDGDARFTVFALLLVVSLLLPESLRRDLPLVAILGLIALIKFSLLLLALFVVVMTMIARKRLIDFAVFAAVFFIAWFAAGQKLATLPWFLRRGWEVGSGYAGASMSSLVPTAALGAIGLLVVIAIVERRNIWNVIAFAGLIAYVMRVGYVRADLMHAGAANALLLLLLAGFLSVRFPRLAPLVMLIVVVAHGPAFIDHARNQWSWLHDRAAKAAQLEHEMIASKTPPPVRGTIDAFPWESAPLILHGLDYTPRPVFQSCMTWTPKLSELNAEFLRGPKAPEWLWVGVGSIDGHYPLLDDARSWLEMLAHYEIAQQTPDHLLLRKSSGRQPAVLVPLGQPGTAVPPLDYVWCEIDVRQSLAARIHDAILAPRPITLETTLADGTRTRWVVPVAMLRGGFLLSPQVTNVNELAQLFEHRAARRVVALRLIGAEDYIIRFSAVKTRDRV